MFPVPVIGYRKLKSMSVVEDFERQLGRKSKATFAQWHAIDLHNHSPQSYDYRASGEDLAERTASRIRDAGISLAMFTDHERLPDPGFVAQVAEQSGALILRGVELNVFVDAWGKPEGRVGKDLFFHLLVGFDPDGSQSPEYWLSHLSREGGEEERQAGNQKIRGVTASIEQICGLLEDSNAIVIPAHLHSTSDAFKSRSIDDIYADREFLKHAERDFTALEVTSEKTAAFFDGGHEETGKLLKTCIQSSDSHEPETIGSRPTYVQMERPSFAELKAALELPFRVSLAKPSEPPSHIVGLHIRGEFFPDLWLKLSPHCNVLIGVKGSGKTSVLECLRYVLGAGVPATRKEKVREHLEAILGPSGSVRALLKREDGTKLLVERSIASTEYQVTFPDDRREAFANPEAIQFPAYVLGWHEIEQAATDANIRRLYMDTIAGRESVRKLEEEAKAFANQVRHKHDSASNKYGIFRDVLKQVRELEEFRKGLQNLTDANLVALKAEYEAAIEHREQFGTATEHLRNALSGLSESVAEIVPGLDRDAFTGASPLDVVTKDARRVVERLFADIDRFDEKTTAQLGLSIQELETLKAKADAVFSDFSRDYERRLSSLTPEQRSLLDSHRSVAEKTKELPRLTTELAARRNDAETLLRELASLCGEITQRIEARTELRRNRVNEFNESIKEYCVRLAVQPHQQPFEYQDLTQRYRRGWEAVGELPTAPLMHSRLKGAYEQLLRNLESGQPVFFRDAEFGYFLDVFENDDLKIEFDVTAAGDVFRPIDQLSAGQRCTAIFPLLLKLRSGPLVVDQPEDNLDNRHIANSIAPALSEDKKSRQIIFTSHNANLVVLSDAELVVAFESTGSEGKVESQGFLATRDSPITRHVLEILDGGTRALELRYKKYGGVSPVT